MPRRLAMRIAGLSLSAIRPPTTQRIFGRVLQHHCGESRCRLDNTAAVARPPAWYLCGYNSRVAWPQRIQRTLCRHTSPAIPMSYSGIRQATVTSLQFKRAIAQATLDRDVHENDSNVSPESIHSSPLPISPNVGNDQRKISQKKVVSKVTAIKASIVQEEPTQQFHYGPGFKASIKIAHIYNVNP